MKRCNFEDFTRRTSLPARATESELEKLGARYSTTKPFIDENVEKRIEYMMLDNKEVVHIWKRTIPGPELYEIHIDVDMDSATRYFGN